MTAPHQIRPSENLGRGAFPSGHAKSARRGQVPARIFLERKGAIEISVDRLDHAPPAEAAAVADGNAAARNRTFYAWAVVSAQKAAANGRRVKASPKLDNLYHADIVLPTSAAEDREEQIGHAQELADNSSWREHPAALERS